MDFSGASLKLNAEGEDKVLGVLDKIDKKAQQATENWGRLTTEEVSRAAAAFDDLYGRQSSGLQKLSEYEREVSAEHISRMRQQAVADREAEQAQNALARTQGEVEAATNRSARGALAASRALEVMGRTGKEAGRSLDTLLTQVGYLAFGFGAEGALVGAIAIGTAAIVELFNRTGREMDKLQETYQHTIESIAKSGSALRADQAKQEAYSGDPFAEITGRNKDESDIQFLARSRGLLGLQAERSRLFQREANQVANADFDPEVQKSNLKKVRDAIAEVDREVGLLGVQWSKANALEDSFVKKAVEEQNQAAKRAREKRDERADERSVAGYQNEELDRIVQRIKASGDLTVALTNEHNDVVALRNEQQLLRYELDQGNLSVKDRIEKEKELARVTKELEQTSGTSIFMNGTNVRVNPKAAPLPSDKPQIDAIKESGKKMAAEADRAGQQIASALNNGIMSALQAGTISGGFKALTQAVLKGLGDMFAQIAEKALIAATFMQKITAFLVANPWLAAAAAVAMLTFAKSIGGTGGGGGGYSGSSSTASYGTVIDRGYINPGAPTAPVTNPSSIVAKPSVTNVNYIIGPADPVAQRMYDELQRRSANRGSLG